MDVQDAIRKKNELDKSIGKLVQTFNNETGLFVDDIHVIKIDRAEGTIFFAVETKVTV